MADRSTRRKTLHEAAHKVDLEGRADGDGEDDVRASKRPFQKPSLNMAAHKLGYWSPDDDDDGESEAEQRRRFAALEDSQRDVVAHAGKAVLALGALGIVYGDIGTSPLYTEQVIFTTHRAAAHPTTGGRLRRRSLIFWALMVVVSIKYAGFIMRAHNRGDGGIMALTALLKRNHVAHVARAGDARDLRRGAVLRRRDHHAGDLRARRAPGVTGRDPEPRPSRRADLGRDPDRVVRAPAVRLGPDRVAVRAGDAGLVHHDRGARARRRSSRTRPCSRRCRPAGASGSSSATGPPGI